MRWGGEVPCHAYDSVGIVYVEVPKCGATSIKWALSPFIGGPPPETEDIHRWSGYIDARDVAQMQDWLEHRWAGYFRFTVLRDPVARFESLYWSLPAYDRGAGGDVNRYILEEFSRDPRWKRDIHCVPQTLIVGDASGFDHVGRTEDLGATQRALREHTDLPVKIPHANRSKAKRTPLSVDAIGRLHELYAADYELLGAL